MMSYIFTLKAPPWVNTVFQFVRFSVEVAFAFVSLFYSTFDMTLPSDCAEFSVPL